MFLYLIVLVVVGSVSEMIESRTVRLKLKLH